MNILFIGDIVGKVGRKALLFNLENIKKKYNIDFTIANGENISNGRGMNPTHYEFLINNGVDCITLGNHFLDKLNIEDVIDNFEVVRPLNIKNYTKGEGTRTYICRNIKIRVTNLMGHDTSKKMEILEPYETINEIIKNDYSDIHIVDFHAEYSGEKKALAYALNGKVTALIGTHTHVQTRDNQILNNGSAYITDVGMCGSYNSVLGDKIESVVNKIIFHDEKSRFELLDDDDMIFSACVINISNTNYRAKSITPIYIIKEKGK